MPFRLRMDPPLRVIRWLLWTSPVQDGIGKCGLVDVRVPLIDRKLTGDERGFLVLAILEDLQRIPL